MFSVVLIICIVCVVIVGNLFVGVKFYLTTVNVVVAGTTRVVLGGVFLPFELMTLFSIVAWLLQWWRVDLCFFWVLLCGLLRHSIYLQLIWSVQTIQFHLLFKM